MQFELLFPLWPLGYSARSLLLSPYGLVPSACICLMAKLAEACPPSLGGVFLSRRARASRAPSPFFVIGRLFSLPSIIVLIMAALTLWPTHIRIHPRASCHHRCLLRFMIDRTVRDPKAGPCALSIPATAICGTLWIYSRRAKCMGTALLGGRVLRPKGQAVGFWYGWLIFSEVLHPRLVGARIFPCTHGILQYPYCRCQILRLSLVC